MDPHNPHSSTSPSPTLCREKFWRVGQKERDGDYGACFFPQNRGLVPGQPPLLYCARPGSRMWEANFNGDVQSTHQFKQLLACPPLPLISYRHPPHRLPAQFRSRLQLSRLTPLSSVGSPAGLSLITTLSRRTRSPLPSINCCILGNSGTTCLGMFPHANPNSLPSHLPMCVLCRDQNLLTWTDSAIYIFTPQTGQVLLWTEVKGQFWGFATSLQSQQQS